jgi:uncharacterized protein with beta-barrel porin domain
MKATYIGLGLLIAAITPSAQSAANAVVVGVTQALAQDLDETIFINVVGTNDTEGILSNASAIATGVGAEVTGNINGYVTVIAEGGSASSSSNETANTEAKATGIDSIINGNVTGQIVVKATGGTASSAIGYADADAYAYGINHEKMTGNITGTILVTSAGGTASTGSGQGECEAYAAAISDNLTGDVTGEITIIAEGGSVTTGDGDIRADAETSGIFNTMRGNVSGSITSIAEGGTGTTGNGNLETSAEAYGINGSLYGNLSGTITSIAIGGTATSGSSANEQSITNANAEATAVGINGDMDGNLSGNIFVFAQGGTNTFLETQSDIQTETSSESGNDNNIDIYNFTGGIISMAIPGVIINGSNTNLSLATATGIEATETLSLIATGGLIAAVIVVPEGFTESDLPDGSYATAIKGGDGNDVVKLSNISITGDIVLSGGTTNTLTILGDTYLDGDIGRNGTNDTTVTLSGGLLYPVGTVHVSELGSQSLSVEAEGGLGFTLYHDVEDEQNSKLEVQGSVDAKSGASIAAFPGTYDNCCDIIGQTYEVINADEGVTGEFVENEFTIFAFDITQTSNTVSITPTGIKTQDIYCFSTAPTTSADITMLGISKQASSTRAMLRETADHSASSQSPKGAAGPLVRQLKRGEWVGFVRQFNDLGGLDSDGAQSGYKWDTSGIMFGVERLVQENVIAGLVASGASTDIDGQDGGGGGNSEMMDIAVYGNYFADKWSAEAGLFYGRAKNKTQRIATDLQLYEANYDSNIYGTWAEVGHLMTESKHNVEPYVRLSYVTGNHEGYTETSDGLAPLTIDSNRTANLNSEFGARMDRKWMLENEKELHIELKAAWRHEILDDTITINGSILGISQTFQPPTPARNSLVLGIRTDWQLNDTMSFGLEYEPTIASDWYNHSFGGTFKYQF